MEVYIDTTFYHIILTFQAYNYPTCGCDQVPTSPRVAATYANQTESEERRRAGDQEAGDAGAGAGED